MFVCFFGAVEEDEITKIKKKKKAWLEDSI